MSRELLDLSTIVDRPTVRIRSKLHPQGKSYEILAPNELSLYQTAVVEAKAGSLDDLDVTRKPTAAQERARRKSLLDLVEIVAPSIEEKVRRGLSDVQLLAIYGAFAGLLDQDEDGDSGNAVAARTSGGSSRASNGSTAATRKAGSGSRSTSSTRT